jgi:hypothetical protein
MTYNTSLVNEPINTFVYMLSWQSISVLWSDSTSVNIGGSISIFLYSLLYLFTEEIQQ